MNETTGDAHLMSMDDRRPRNNVSELRADYGDKQQVRTGLNIFKNAVGASEQSSLQQSRLSTKARLSQKDNPLQLGDYIKDGEIDTLQMKRSVETDQDGVFQSAISQIQSSNQDNTLMIREDAEVHEFHDGNQTSLNLLTSNDSRVPYRSRKNKKAAPRKTVSFEEHKEILDIENVNGKSLDEIDEIFPPERRKIAQKNSKIIGQNVVADDNSSQIFFNNPNENDDKRPIECKAESIVNMGTMMSEELTKQYTVTLLNKKRCCLCCRLESSIGYIACYVKLRAIGLILTSFVPPLIEKTYEKSLLYPDGRSLLMPYFDDSTLLMLFTMNVIFSFFLLCYGIASYYTWLVNQSELMSKNRVDRRMYPKLLRTHQGFIAFLIIQASILLIIDSMKLPEQVIIFKPPYLLLGICFVLELYIYYEVNRYVQIMMTVRLPDLAEIEELSKDDQFQKKLAAHQNSIGSIQPEP